MTAEQRKAVEDAASKLAKEDYNPSDEVIQLQRKTIYDYLNSAFIAGAEFALEGLNQSKYMTEEDCIEKLKDLGVYEQFVKNLTNSGLDIETYKSRHGSFRGYIAGAFHWSDTPEGCEFWSNISNK